MTKPPEIPDNRSAWEKAQPERKNCEECGWPHDACCCVPPPKTVKPYCGECGGEHEPSGARSDCVIYWKRRAVVAENLVNVVKHYGAEGIKPL